MQGCFSGSLKKKTQCRSMSWHKGKCHRGMQKYCHRVPFINVLAAAGLVKVLSCSQKFFSALTSAKCEQCVAAGVPVTVSCTVFNCPMLVVAFIPSMSPRCKYITFTLYLYRDKFLNYLPSNVIFLFLVTIQTFIFWV